MLVSREVLFFFPRKYFTCNDQKSKSEAREVRHMKKNKEVSLLTRGDETFWKPTTGREASG